MISNSARQGFDQLLHQGLRSAFTGADDSVTDIVPVASMDDIPESLAVMLVVSSYRFRLMMWIHFEPDAATREHFARLHGVPLDQMSGQAFNDVINECGNMACGALNRGLGRTFPHVGMSTPYVLDCRSLEHLHLLQHGHCSHARLTLNGNTRFHGSLAVRAYDRLDFEPKAEEEVEVCGELEMF